CRLVLREPYQLRCGHHRCQLCIDEKQCITHWSTCTGTCAIKSVRFDADFQTELECLLISCYVCNWTGPLKKYQEHLDDNHGNRFLICSLCNKQKENYGTLHDSSTPIDVNKYYSTSTIDKKQDSSSTTTNSSQR
ncbi:unnamed protein product, partial [Rotaria socialis]